MVSVYGKNRYANVQVWIFIVDGRKSKKHEVPPGNGQVAMTYENPSAFPSSGSLSSSTDTGLSLKVCSRRSAVVR